MKRLNGLKLEIAAAALALLMAATAHAGPPKVTICHQPPGNPENAKTISVNIHAWPAHRSHGDKLGECSPDGDPDNDGDDPDAGGGSSDGGGSSGGSVGGGGGSGGGSYGGGTFEALLCDGRKGEHGRLIQVTETGRVAVNQAECE